MVSDVTIHFSADASDLLAGVEDVQEALGSLSPQLVKLADDIGEAAESANPANARFADMAKLLQQGLVSALGPAAQGFTALGAATSNAADATKATIDGEIKAQQEALAIKKTIYDGEARLKQISEEEKLRLTIAATQAEYEGQRALLEKEAALDDLSVQQKQQISNRIESLQATHVRQMLQLAYRAAQEQEQIWQEIGEKISAQMSSTIMGLLQHTTTLREAFRQIALQITQYFVKMGTDWIGAQAAAVAKNVATQALGEQQMTAATALGVTERSGLAATAAVSDAATKAAAVLKSILASGAETFAGVFGFMAPLLGPAAVGPAAAAQATVLGVASAASFDIGAYQVPHDLLSIVHRDELVMPAAQASAFRSLLEGGGAAGGSGHTINVAPNVHFNISALDGASVESVLNANGRALARAVGKHVADGAHYGIRGLTR